MANRKPLDIATRADLLLPAPRMLLKVGKVLRAVARDI
jgi:hypothetical protein